MATKHTSAAAANPPRKKKSAAETAAARSRSRRSPTSRPAAKKPAANSRTQPRKRAGGVQENPVARRANGRQPAPVRGGRSRTAVRAEGKKPAPPHKASPRRRPAPRPDPYDAYDLPPRRRRDSRAARRHSVGFGLLNLVLLAAVLCLVGLGVWRTMEYRALAEMKEVVSRQTFPRGTTVEGVDVSAMTLPRALDYWAQEVEPSYRERGVTLDDGTHITAADLGYFSNYETVLSRAWNAGQAGSLKQRYALLTAGSAREYRVERILYDDAAVRSAVAALAGQIDAAPQDACVRGFDTDTLAFDFAPEEVGYQLDREALVNDIESALNAGGGRVTRHIETLAPAVTQENVAAQYGEITSAVTNASSSSDNRISNIRLAVSIINGTRLQPGEQFSFNETVGERTRSRGFKLATAYSSGTVTEEVGGGICQVSTTLFNAAVKADLKIDERHPHSLTVSYVDLGKDAAVDWGNKDLRFTNKSDDVVYIICSVSKDKRVHFSVYGKLLPDGETITVEGVRTGKIPYETQKQVSFELPSGKKRKIQSGKEGYTATTYKVRWDAEGKEISRKELCKSSYKATPEIIAYGP